jgi:hypothetical protein
MVDLSAVVARGEDVAALAVEEARAFVRGLAANVER